MCLSNNKVKTQDHSINKEDAHQLHGLLYFLNFACNGSQDWKEGNHHGQPQNVEVDRREVDVTYLAVGKQP